MSPHPFVSSTLAIDHLQFAQNGVWEEVQTVYPNSFEDLYNLSDWLNRAGRDIAVETLFLDERSELFGFFGVRTKDFPSADRTLMWMRLATSTASEKSRPFSELMSLCLTALELPSALPDIEPTFELGVFNFWNTAVPVILGKSPVGKLTELIAKQRGPSWLYEGHKAPICLEYVWQVPTHLWISRNISTKSNGLYFIDMEKVKRIYYNKAT